MVQTNILRTSLPHHIQANTRAKVVHLEASEMQRESSRGINWMVYLLIVQEAQ